LLATYPRAFGMLYSLGSELLGLVRQAWAGVSSHELNRCGKGFNVLTFL